MILMVQIIHYTGHQKMRIYNEIFVHDIIIRLVPCLNQVTIINAKNFQFKNEK